MAMSGYNYRILCNIRKVLYILQGDLSPSKKDPKTSTIE